MAGFLQFVHAPSQMRLARAGGAGQQDGRLRAHRHSFDLFDQPVEGPVARGNATLEEFQRVVPRLAEAAGQHVVARQVQVDQRVLAGILARLLPGRGGLQQHAGNGARFHHQEHADLRDVGAGGDVRPILLALGIEAVAARPVVQRCVHLAEVPGIGEVHRDQIHDGVGRQIGDVLLHQPRQGLVARWIEQLQPVDQRVLVLDQRYRGPPFRPAARALAGIQLGAQEADDDVLLCMGRDS